MFDRAKFEEDKRINSEKLFKSEEVNEKALSFITESDKLGYAYNWSWLGLPVIQMPEDIVLAQEIVWKNQPDVIIETGIAWGGSVALNASILELLGKGRIYAIDKVLPQSNIDEIMKYNFSKRIELYESSSTDSDLIKTISSKIKSNESVMLILDSNHTHQHVYDELRMWSKLVTPGQLIIVSDTIVEEIPEQQHKTRPWGHGDNPMTAVNKFLEENNSFTRDNEFNARAICSFTRNGYLLKS